MAVATGLNTVVGCGVESTYGTPVVVDRWFEILSESLERRNNVIASNGMRPGGRNFRRGSRRVLSSNDGGGDVTMEVPTNGFSRIIQQILGGTPTIAQQAATTAYLHTHTMSTLQGRYMTWQKSLRDATNTAIGTFTFHGAKVTAAEFSIAVDQILQCKLTLDAEDVDTVTSPAAASYNTTKLFHFKQGDLKVDGSSVAQVTNANVTIENALKTDRYYLGSAGLKKEPAENDFPTANGTLSAEFIDLTTFHNRFAADTAAALVLEFVGDTIASTYKETFRITIPEVHFTGETPKVGGPDVVVQNIPYEAASTGSSAGVTIEYMTTDVTA